MKLNSLKLLLSFLSLFCFYCRIRLPSTFSISFYNLIHFALKIILFFQSLFIPTFLLLALVFSYLNWVGSLLPLLSCYPPSSLFSLVEQETVCFLLPSVHFNFNKVIRNTFREQIFTGESFLSFTCILSTSLFSFNFYFRKICSTKEFHRNWNKL